MLRGQPGRPAGRAAARDARAGGAVCRRGGAIGVAKSAAGACSSFARRRAGRVRSRLEPRATAFPPELEPQPGRRAVRRLRTHQLGGVGRSGFARESFYGDDQRRGLRLVTDVRGRATCSGTSCVKARRLLLGRDALAGSRTLSPRVAGGLAGRFEPRARSGWEQLVCAALRSRRSRSAGVAGRRGVRAPGRERCAAPAASGFVPAGAQHVVCARRRGAAHSPGPRRERREPGRLRPGEGDHAFG